MCIPCTLFLGHVSACTTIFILSEALKEGDSQSCLAFLVNSRWISPDASRNGRFAMLYCLASLVVLLRAFGYRAVNCSFHEAAVFVHLC
ncbi:hypothetical protein MTR67_018464 [Solanum verrucosum]|uniref:Uncharacterized protein n=1 Tax=Solanum verrucosum TaxID=315347 RepID=A0AAF0QJR1_SOLVR|nr:hypothetical protein MTR67_018464 [Solanum verrucosum]